jgi:hypothetical protein
MTRFVSRIWRDVTVIIGSRRESGGQGASLEQFERGWRSPRGSEDFITRQSDSSSIRESSVAALEMDLKVVRELMRVDDTSQILEIAQDASDGCRFVLEDGVCDHFAGIAAQPHH